VPASVHVIWMGAVVLGIAGGILAWRLARRMHGPTPPELPGPPRSEVLRRALEARVKQVQEEADSQKKGGKPEET